MPPEELLRRMDSRDLGEMMAWSKIRGPVGRDEREDIRTALTCLVLARVNGNKKAELSHFMPQWDRPKQREQTVAEQKMLIRAVAKRARKGA